MAQITVLGAGLVAGPAVRHLLERSTHDVTVAALDVARAKELVAGHARGRAEALSVDDAARLDDLVAASDVVISLLPYAHHVTVAERCLAHRRHLVTTSYVSPAMRALDARAKDVGVTLLNELGLDPGIDHMSAMRVIHAARAEGGRVVSFRSYCGGLPAPEANDNPFGYKFSWSPRGVVLAARNAARFLRDGALVEVPNARLFADPEHVAIDGVGAFEGYPNRDSLAYIPQYDLDGVETMFRGTLRHLGHCETWRAMGAMGLYDDAPRAVSPRSARALMASLGDVSVGDDVEAAVARRAGIARDAAPLEKLAWLGMFDDAPLPDDVASPLDALVARMTARMQYAPGERDMVVLRHEFVVAFGDRRERRRSTLVDYGIPHGDSAMSRTVGLPAALGALRVLDGTIAARGVVVPVIPEVYGPVLAELDALGVACREETVDDTALRG